MTNIIIGLKWLLLYDQIARNEIFIKNSASTDDILVTWQLWAHLAERNVQKTSNFQCVELNRAEMIYQKLISNLFCFFVGQIFTKNIEIFLHWTKYRENVQSKNKIKAFVFCCMIKSRKISCFLEYSLFTFKFAGSNKVVIGWTVIYFVYSFQIVFLFNV